MECVYCPHVWKGEGVVNKENLCTVLRNVSALNKLIKWINMHCSRNKTKLYSCCKHLIYLQYKRIMASIQHFNKKLSSWEGVEGGGAGFKIHKISEFSSYWSAHIRRRERRKGVTHHSKIRLHTMFTNQKRKYMVAKLNLMYIAFSYIINCKHRATQFPPCLMTHCLQERFHLLQYLDWYLRPLLQGVPLCLNNIIGLLQMLD